MATVTDVFDFDDSSTPSAVDTLRGHCKVKRIDETLQVEFKTNGGKGSGPQRVALTELLDFASVLSERYEAGEAEAVEAGYIPAPVQLARSFRRVANPGVTDKSGSVPFNGRDWYEWNSSTGQGNASKGSKPAKIPVDEMAEFLDLFHDRVGAIISKARAAGLISDEDVDEDEDEVDLDNIE